MYTDVPVASTPIELVVFAAAIAVNPYEAPAAAVAVEVTFAKISDNVVPPAVYSVVNVLPFWTKDTLILSVDLISNQFPLRSANAVNAVLLAVAVLND